MTRGTGKVEEADMTSVMTIVEERDTKTEMTETVNVGIHVTRMSLIRDLNASHATKKGPEQIQGNKTTTDRELAHTRQRHAMGNTPTTMTTTTPKATPMTRTWKNTEGVGAPTGSRKDRVRR